MLSSVTWSLWIPQQLYLYPYIFFHLCSVCLQKNSSLQLHMYIPIYWCLCCICFSVLIVIEMYIYQRVCLLYYKPTNFIRYLGNIWNIIRYLATKKELLTGNVTVANWIIISPRFTWDPLSSMRSFPAVEAFLKTDLSASYQVYWPSWLNIWFTVSLNKIMFPIIAYRGTK